MARANNKKLIFILKLCVSTISLYIVFSKTDIRQIFFLLKDIKLLSFFTASVVYIAAQFLSSIRWKLLLPGEFDIKKLFSLYLIGAFFSTFLPSVIGGDAVKAYYLNKDAQKMGLTLASIFMDRYLGFVSLMIIGILSFPFAMGYFGGTVYKWMFPVIFLAFVVGSFVFFSLRIGRRFRVAADFYDYFGFLRGKKDVIIKALLLSFIIQLMNFFMVGILAIGLGENIPLLVLGVFLPIIITLTSLPISISGLGVREGSFVVLLGLIGFRPELATSISLAWFFSVFVGSLPGLAAYMGRTNHTKPI